MQHAPRCLNGYKRRFSEEEEKIIFTFLVQEQGQAQTGTFLSQFLNLFTTNQNLLLCLHE